MIALADTATEKSSCCDANVTYSGADLVCKACFAEVEWGYL